MGRTSFPQNTSYIRTMDFSRDFGARRGKILSSHRVSTRWENHTMGAHKDLARKRGKARESKIYARENTKNSTSFSGSGTFGLSKLSDILAGPLHIFNPNNALS